MRTFLGKLSVPALIALLIPWVNAQEIAGSQKKWISFYEKQPVVPKPADMLLNTDEEPPLEEGFVTLYNGKNLEGWYSLGGKARFEATGDSITGTTVKGTPSTYLTTVRNDYTDFIFTAELKWEVDGNSGIMFRSRPKTEKKIKTVQGPQLEMEEKTKQRFWSGGIYGQSCGGWFYPLWLDAHEEARNAVDRDGWNRVTILAQGDTVKTWVNGIPAAHWKNSEFLKGFFGLQIHSGKKGSVKFRNLEVKELTGD